MGTLEVFVILPLYIAMILLQIQAHPVIEGPSTYEDCIMMTDAKASAIDDIVQEVTEFIDKLAEKHEDLDLRLIKLTIDKHNVAETDDSTTVLELFVNDCANKINEATNSEVQVKNDDAKQSVNGTSIISSNITSTDEAHSRSESKSETVRSDTNVENKTNKVKRIKTQFTTNGLKDTEENAASSTNKQVTINDESTNVNRVNRSTVNVDNINRYKSTSTDDINIQNSRSSSVDNKNTNNESTENVQNINNNDEETSSGSKNYSSKSSKKVANISENDENDSDENDSQNNRKSSSNNKKYNRKNSRDTKNSNSKKTSSDNNFLTKRNKNKASKKQQVNTMSDDDDDDDDDETNYQSKFSTDDNKLLTSLKQIIRNEVLSINNNDNAENDDAVNIDDKSRGKNDCDVKSKPQLITLELHETDFPVVNDRRKMYRNNYNYNPWVGMYLKERLRKEKHYNMFV